MERMASWARPTGMMENRRIRGLAAAGLLCAGLAGCGTTVASAAPSTTPHSSGTGQAVLAVATRVAGCASVNQATSATVKRLAAARGGPRTYTQRDATLVRTLFGDFCAALARAGLPEPAFQCIAAEHGNSYTGTFYDGRRTLATFSYRGSGCPQISLTALGQTRTSLLLAKVAAAAPHLKADLAAVLGVPESHV